MAYAGSEDLQELLARKDEELVITRNERDEWERKARAAWTELDLMQKDMKRRRVDEFQMQHPMPLEPTAQKQKSRPPCLFCGGERDRTQHHVINGVAECVARADPVFIRRAREKSSKKPKQGMLFPLYNPGFWVRRLCDCGAYNFEPSAEFPEPFNHYRCLNCQREFIDDPSARDRWMSDVTHKKKMRWATSKSNKKNHMNPMAQMTQGMNLAVPSSIQTTPPMPPLGM